MMRQVVTVVCPARAPAPDPRECHELSGNGLDEHVQSLARHGRYQQHVATNRLGQSVTHLCRAGKFRFRNRHDLRTLTQGRFVLHQLLANGVVIGDGVAAIQGGRLDQVHQNPGPLDMPQKLVTQADPTVRTLDQSRNIGQHERSIGVYLHAAQVRDLRRERVVGDLRDAPARGGSTAYSCQRSVCRSGPHRRSP